MVRQIIHIDEEKCNGCGLCASACHEGAIEMVNGKALSSEINVARSSFVTELICLSSSKFISSIKTGTIELGSKPLNTELKCLFILSLKSLRILASKSSLDKAGFKSTKALREPFF